jgi:hypothetical protein
VLLFARSSNPRVNRRRGAGGVPPPVLNYGKRAKTQPYKDEGYAPFQDPFPTLWISQFASFAHFF